MAATAPKIVTGSQ